METYQNVSAMVISAVANIKSLPEEEVSLEDHILYDLYLDSVDLIELLTFVEDELKIVIDDEALEGVTTLASIVDLITDR
nr:phosphopantetheine-binding protein [uncultured Enterobacter sp.]